MAKATQVSLDFAAALDETIQGYEFSVIAGRVYDKVIQASLGAHRNGQRSVHAFINRTNGDLIKPAGWSAPQRSPKTGELAVRFNLATEAGFIEAVSAATFSGGYLYAR